MSLQAYIDDSGTKGSGRVLMLGGIMARADVLAPMADEWDRELRSKVPGSIAYFKAEQARNFNGEFRHWRPSARDEKVRRLASIVDRPDVIVVFSGVNLSGHQQAERFLAKSVTDAKHHHGNQPLFLAFHALMIGLADEAKRLATMERIEIFIDRHDVFKRDLQEQYRVLLEVLDKQRRDLPPDDVYFRDDREFVLLQVADLLMGDMWRRDGRDEKWPKIEFKNLGISPYSKPITDARLFELTQLLTGLPLRRVKQ